MGFTSLYAYDFCGNVGSVYTSITMAFDPDELSSVGPPLPFSTTTETDTYTPVSNSVLLPLTTETSTDIFYTPGPATLINYADLSQNCSTIEGYSFVPGNPSQFQFVSKFVFPI